MGTNERTGPAMTTFHSRMLSSAGVTVTPYVWKFENKRWRRSLGRLGLGRTSTGFLFRSPSSYTRKQGHRAVLCCWEGGREGEGWGLTFAIRRTPAMAWVQVAGVFLRISFRCRSGREQRFFRPRLSAVCCLSNV
jgi:hypothetical protein